MVRSFKRQALAITNAPLDHVRALRAQVEGLREALALLGMRVLQSDLVLDEKEAGARDLGVEIHCAALQGGKDDG